MEYLPPDPGAAKLWLVNRQPDRWRDTSKVEVEASAKVEIDAPKIDFSGMSEQALIELCRAFGLGSDPEPYPYSDATARWRQPGGLPIRRVNPQRPDDVPDDVPEES
jgi:hypothetical protein